VLIATKLGDNSKTPIYVVDEMAKNYDEKNPWATAKALTYAVGKKNGGISGKSFRENHPLKDIGTKVDAQVFKEDLIDLTDEFNQVLKDGIPVFNEVANLPGGMFGIKGGIFKELVTDGAPFDLKSTKTDDGTPSYAATVIGEWSLLNGTLRRYDDYGNISYGTFGKAAGFSDSDLYRGSNMNQIYKDIIGKTKGNGDENRDIYMIQTGIYNSQFLLKK